MVPFTSTCPGAVPASATVFVKVTLTPTVWPDTTVNAGLVPVKVIPEVDVAVRVMVSVPGGSLEREGDVGLQGR